MSNEASFKFNSLCGSVFHSSAGWTGNWSEDGGAPTHELLMTKRDDVPVFAFRKVGGRAWSYAPIEFHKGFEERSLKGSVVFKGHTLSIWLNFAKGHDGEAEHARYDLKPRPKVELPY